MAYQQGDLAMGLVAFNESAKTDPNSVLGPFGAGNVYLANNLTAEAVRSFQQVTRIDPKLAVAYKALGDAYYYLQRNRDADGMYQRARVLQYGGQDLMVAMVKNQSQLLIDERRWRQAVFTLQDLVGKAPSAELYLMLAQCYEETNQKMSAAQAYIRATELDRQSAVGHYRLGLLLYQSREYRAAWDAFDRAIALDPAGTKIDLEQAREKRGKVADKLHM
jgi:tetratricopeptide (TPR) repeat protein